jgi:membrane protein
VTRPALRLVRAVFGKFFADRGTHLAAMIAYFALVSLVPLVFLALSILGLTGRPSESTFLVRELKKTFPGTSIADIVNAVRSIQRNAATLGIIGGVFLAWSSLSLVSVLESAFNIVYGRPNRSFVHGKAIAVLVTGTALVTLFVALVVGSFGYDVVRHFAPGFVGNRYVAYTLPILVSLGALLIFLVSVYYVLTNERLRVKEVLPGAVTAAIVLEASFQLLPLYVRLSSDVLAARALGTPALLLVWLYVMANVIVFGAELNWWLARGPREAGPAPVSAPARGPAAPQPRERGAS